MTGRLHSSFGDSLVTNCTFFSGTVAQHVGIFSGGGYRLENNKVNGSRPGGYGIVVSPILTGATGSPNIEPLFIVGNSIEGQDTGILFQRTAGNGITSAVLINSNEIYCGSRCIWTRAGQANEIWITGMTITGNVLIINQNNSIGVELDGAQLVSFTGNVITLSAAATVAQSFLTGPHSNSIVQVGTVTNIK